MAASEQTPDTHHPLIGRIVHAAIQLGVIGGPALLGWSLAASRFPQVVLALLLGGLAAVLWWGTATAGDVEASPLGIVTVPGKVRLIIELGLVIAAGISIWIGWNRAAGETFLTLALLDYAVRYQRLVTLWRAA